MLFQILGASILSLSSAFALTGLISTTATQAAGCPCAACDCGDCDCSETGVCDCDRDCCVDGCVATHTTEFAAAAVASPKTSATQMAPACCAAKAACCEEGAACCEVQAVDVAACPGCAGSACQAAGCNADGCCEGGCHVESCECAAGCCEAGCCAK